MGGFRAAAWTWGRAALRGASGLQPSLANTLQAGARLKAAYTALPQGRVGTGAKGEAEKQDPPLRAVPLPGQTQWCPGAPRQPPGPRPPEAPPEPTSRTVYWMLPLLGV